MVRNCATCKHCVDPHPYTHIYIRRLVVECCDIDEHEISLPFLGGWRCKNYERRKANDRT